MVVCAEQTKRGRLESKPFSHFDMSGDASLLKRVQLLEDELRQRNADCAALMTENRVLKSHSEALKEAQRTVLLLQDQATRLGDENKKLRAKVAAQELELSKEAHSKRMRELALQLEGGPGGSSGTLPCGSPQAPQGGVTKLSAGSTVILQSSSISSIGFPAAAPIAPSQSVHDGGEAEVSHMLDQVKEMTLLDIKHAELQDEEERRLEERFRLLQSGKR